MTKMDFHEISPLDQFKSESKEFVGYFYVYSISEQLEQSTR